MIRYEIGNEKISGKQEAIKQSETESKETSDLETLETESKKTSDLETLEGESKETPDLKPLEDASKEKPDFKSFEDKSKENPDFKSFEDKSKENPDLSPFEGETKENPYSNSSDNSNGKSGDQVEIQRTEMFFAPTVIIISMMIVECVFFHMNTFLMTVSVIGVLALSRIYLQMKGYTFEKKNNIHFGVLVVFALAYSITANFFLCTLVTLFEAAGVCMLCYLVTQEKEEPDFCLPERLVQSVFRMPVSNNNALLRSLKKLFSSTNISKNLAYVLLGLVITIPLTVIVGSLLMSADDGVARILTGMLNQLLPNVFKIGWRLILGFILASIIISMLVSCAARNIIRVNELQVQKKLWSMRVAPALVLIAGVVPICVLYGIFFYSQAGYLLAAFANKLPEGFSYAEYARQGFFELCALSVINLMVIIAMQVLSRKDERLSLPVKVSGIVICTITLFLIATAMRKMILYIQTYGLTPLRFYTSWFMALLAAIFVLIIVWLIKRETKIFENSLKIFVVFFFILVFSRPDAIIAGANYSIFHTEEYDHVDYDTICDLSDDAWSVLADKEGVPDFYKSIRLSDLNEDGDSCMNISSIIAKYKLKAGEK